MYVVLAHIIFTKKHVSKGLVQIYLLTPILVFCTACQKKKVFLTPRIGTKTTKNFPAPELNDEMRDFGC